MLAENTRSLHWIYLDSGALRCRVIFQLARENPQFWKSNFDVVRWRKSHGKSHGKSMNSENHKQNIAKSKCIQSIQSFIMPKCSMSQWSEGSRQQKRIAQFHDLIHAHMACFRRGGTKGINCKHIRGYPLLKQAISKGIYIYIVRCCHLFPEE